MRVFVKNMRNQPLMPCTPRKAKKLLKEGKAKVVRVNPFTIKLTIATGEAKQEIIAGIDSGSKVIGTAVVSNGEVIYQAETLLRGEEAKRKMQTRAMYRRSRRGRKLRYRKPRFLNRKASTKLDRLPPSIKHKIEAHLRERKFVESIMPVTKWIIELAQFDIHKITNPKVKGKEYQEGDKKNYYNIKSYILNRDKYCCQKCKSKRQNIKLHVHHIIFKSNGGTNTPNNLMTLCKTCHNKLHLSKNAEKISLKLQNLVKKNTKHATEISVIKSQLKKKFGFFEETYGYITKFNREALGLSKTHYNDAICVASQGELVKNNLKKYLVRKLVSKGDYQQTKGIRSEKKIPTGKLFGFRKFDLIYSKAKRLLGFVKGKRSSGFFVISNIFGKSLNNSVNVKKESIRICARRLILSSMETV